MNSKSSHGFASDNNSGIHPLLLQAINKANSGHVTAYGDDIYTTRAKESIRKYFGNKAEVFFVLTGTGANVLGLCSVLKSYNSVICASTAHINVDECGAPEKFGGIKLIDVDTPTGKLTPEAIKKHLHGFDFEHHVQPGIISISQPTEMGTVYTVNEIKALSLLAKENNMFLHMDGARLSNAAVYLKKDFKSMTLDAGVDVLSFGGTKNGMLFGESVIFFHPDHASGFKYLRKQSMQLASKLRYIGAQFEVYLNENIWYENASHSNKMAQLLYSKVKNIPQIHVTQYVESNAVFAILPHEVIKPLQEKYFFYVWDEMKNEVRWMTSFDTTPEDVDDFVRLLQSILDKHDI